MSHSQGGKKKFLHQFYTPCWLISLFPSIVKLMGKMFISAVLSFHSQFFLKSTDIWFIMPLLCSFSCRGHQWFTTLNPMGFLNFHHIWFLNSIWHYGSILSRISSIFHCHNTFYFPPYFLLWFSDFIPCPYLKC